MDPVPAGEEARRPDRCSTTRGPSTSSTDRLPVRRALRADGGARRQWQALRARVRPGDPAVHGRHPGRDGRRARRGAGDRSSSAPTTAGSAGWRRAARDRGGPRPAARRPSRRAGARSPARCSTCPGWTRSTPAPACCIRRRAADVPRGARRARAARRLCRRFPGDAWSSTPRRRCSPRWRAGRAEDARRLRRAADAVGHGRRRPPRARPLDRRHRGDRRAPPPPRPRQRLERPRPDLHEAPDHRRLAADRLPRALRT